MFSYYLARLNEKLQQTMTFPAELKYTKDHEWIRFEGDDTAVVGVTDFAQKELGDIVYVDITTVGQTIEEGECLVRSKPKDRFRSFIPYRAKFSNSTQN